MQDLPVPITLNASVITLGADLSPPGYLLLGEGDHQRRLAYRRDDGEGPMVVWLGGFHSDMRSSKAEALSRWARQNGRAFLRFDYSAHGESEGDVASGTISRWLEDACGILDHVTTGKLILVGSSMGGWLSLLLARTHLSRLAGMVLIAPAVDFTESLMWAQFDARIRQEIMENGVWHRPSAYSPVPYPITRDLIEDGRRHLILGAPQRVGCPIHILQGMQDPDVPYSHTLTLMEYLPQDEVTLTLINDGDHRLSRDQDIAKLIAAVEQM